MFVDSKERNHQEKGRTKQNNDFVASEPDNGRYICAGTDGGGQEPGEGFANCAPPSDSFAGGERNKIKILLRSVAGLSNKRPLIRSGSIS